MSQQFTGPLIVLTPYETRCVRAAAAGLTDREIAAETGRSLETIRSQQKAVRTKLNARTRAQAVAVAIRAGIIE